MSTGPDSRLMRELSDFAEEISQQVADKCLELDKKYHLSHDSMEGYFVYCLFKDSMDLPVAKRLAGFEMKQNVQQIS